jgi:hypothetical protein
VGLVRGISWFHPLPCSVGEEERRRLTAASRSP